MGSCHWNPLYFGYVRLPSNVPSPKNSLPHMSLLSVSPLRHSAFQEQLHYWCYLVQNEVSSKKCTKVNGRTHLNY